MLFSREIMFFIKKKRFDADDFRYLNKTKSILSYYLCYYGNFSSNFLNLKRLHTFNEIVFD